MKYSRYWVFLGSYGAMFFMTFVSCFLGQFILLILPEYYMKFGAALLFLVFGIKNLYEGFLNKQEDDESEEIEKEMEELN
jgi:putative Ca2+/H+ antiporter (TMEM165/GDT1 family)